ncbi:MAG: zf-HC2 domain-containing protein [Planctomycetes bacterium]|nr:zf-HC2 domain-containing protein [Planctomycetota bacterium]
MAAQREDPDAERRPDEPGAGDEARDGLPASAARDALEREALAAGRQPAPLHDLERHPPASAECRRIRIAQRDYLDGELDPAAAGEVEEHVHRCRDCALALSRLELEVVRIRKATAEDRDAVAVVPADFTARVMRAVGELVVGTGAAADDAGLSAPDDFTRDVMARVRGEFRREKRRTRWLYSISGRPGHGRLPTALGRALRQVALPVAAFAAALLVTWIVTRSMLEGADARAAIEVVTARDAQCFEAADGAWRGLAAGDLVEPGARLRTRSLGGATLRWSADEDGRDGIGGAGRAERPLGTGAAPVDVVLHGGTEATMLREPGLALVAGDVSWSAGRAVEIRLRDVAVVRLSAGEAFVSLEDVFRADAGLDGVAGVRARVEVLTGTALLERGAGVVESVAAGTVAWFEGLEPTQFEPVASLAMLARSRQDANGDAGRATGVRPVAPVAPRWVGRVVAAGSRAPIAGARVTVLRPGRDEPEELQTDRDGRYELIADPSHVDTLVVDVTPPREIGRACAVRGRVVSLLGRDLRSRSLGDIALDDGAPLRGVVLDPARGLRGPVRVVPWVVDETFGTVEPLEQLAVPVVGLEGAAQGSFAVSRLPQTLDAGETLVLALVDGDFVRCARIVGTDGVVHRDAQPVELAVPLGRAVELAVDGHAGALLTVLETVPGLPSTVCALVHEGVADAAGRLAFHTIGGGELRFVDPDSDAVFEVGLDPGSGLWRPGGAALEHARVGVAQLRIEGVLQRSDDGMRTVTSLARGRRFARFGPVGEGGRTLVVTVHDAVRPAPPVCQVFARSPDGVLGFLGVHDGASAPVLELPWQAAGAGDLELVAIGADGSIGRLRVPQGTEVLDSIELRAPGVIDLGGVASSVVAQYRVVPLDAPGGVERWRTLGGAVGVSVGRLEAGRYRVVEAGVRSWECSVPVGGRVVLDASMLIAPGASTGGAPR